MLRILLSVAYCSLFWFPSGSISNFGKFFPCRARKTNMRWTLAGVISVPNDFLTEMSTPVHYVYFGGGSNCPRDWPCYDMIRDHQGAGL